MKAVILAAGEGRRLRPFTHGQPEAMIPAANKPILEHVIQSLKNCKITDILLVVGYKNERVRDYFEDGKKWGVSITYVEQSQQLGTAHAIKQVASYIKNDFLVLNGDNIVTPALIRDLLNSKTGDASLLTVKRAQTRGYGAVVAKGNKVMKIVEKPAIKISDLVNIGVYLFSPAIFKEIEATPLSPAGEYAITDTLQQMVENGYDVRTVTTKSKYVDAVYPWDLLNVNTSVLSEVTSRAGGKTEKNVSINGNVAIGKNTIIRSGSYIVGPVVIGSNCEVGPSAVILPSTSIGDNVTVSPFTEIRNSIVMNGVYIGSNSCLIDSVVGEGTALGRNFISESRETKVEVEDELHTVTIGSMIGDGCVFGDSTLVRAGRIIGSHCKVGSGNTVSSNLPNDTSVL